LSKQWCRVKYFVRDKRMKLNKCTIW